MSGRLPLIHRIALAVAAVVVCATLGLWAGAREQVPVLPGSGALTGLALGALTAWVLLRPQAPLGRRHTSERRGR